MANGADAAYEPSPRTQQVEVSYPKGSKYQNNDVRSKDIDGGYHS